MSYFAVVTAVSLVIVIWSLPVDLRLAGYSFYDARALLQTDLPVLTPEMVAGVSLATLVKSVVAFTVAAVLWGLLLRRAMRWFGSRFSRGM